MDLTKEEIERLPKIVLQYLDVFILPQTKAKIIEQIEEVCTIALKAKGYYRP